MHYTSFNNYNYRVMQSSNTLKAYKRLTQGWRPAKELVISNSTSATIKISCWLLTFNSKSSFEML